jgi:Pentapeptide repeats (8 copies)
LARHQPFKDIKLSRADVEWLLATHDKGRGSIIWSDESQREREGLDLSGADLRNVDLQELPLAKCCFIQSYLEGTDLYRAHLEGACLIAVHLEGACLKEAHLEGANLSFAYLEGANLYSAFFDSATNLKEIVLSNYKYGTASLCDIHWGDANVAVVNWSAISKLGDEGRSSYPGYVKAARAYRQLSVALRNQGINEDAARFTYRAQLMQRKVFWHERRYAKWLGSLFLDLLTGYGYKPLRCFIAYLLVILTFATTYFIIGHTVGPVLSPVGSAVFSMTSFHGRGFSPGGIALDDPLTVLAALEAFVGLLIEVTFIATLMQRLFSK